jgi:hypothetical protein
MSINPTPSQTLPRAHQSPDFEKPSLAMPRTQAPADVKLVTTRINSDSIAILDL